MVQQNTITTYEKQLREEKKREIAQSRCQICRTHIGDQQYVAFEERYFHLLCLRKGRRHDA